MTDNQLLDVVYARAKKACKQFNSKLDNPRLVLIQQYGKKLYFALMLDGAITPMPLRFSKDGRSQVFILPELPERLMAWKHDIVRDIMKKSNYPQYADFDINIEPKEVVHIFFSAIISALNTPGMSISVETLEIFGPAETYEEVQVEADLMEFGNDWMA